MKPFVVGQSVYYTDLNYKKVSRRIIHAIEKNEDGTPRYWLQCYFGYFSEELLYETHQQAVDALNHFKAFRDRMSDERTKTLPDKGG